MAEYQLTATDNVIRTADGACIPPDMANRDYNGGPQSPGYLQWLADGGVPDPYVPPPEVPPTIAPETQLFYDHENRLLSLEGKPPLTLQDVVRKLAEGKPAGGKPG